MLAPTELWPTGETKVSVIDRSASQSPDPYVSPPGSGVSSAAQNLDGLAGLALANLAQVGQLVRPAAPSRQWSRHLPRLVDAMVMAGCVVLADMVTILHPMSGQFQWLRELVSPRALFIVLTLIISMMVFEAYGLYRRRISWSLFDEFSPVLSSVTITVLLCIAIFWFLHLPLSRGFLLDSWGLGLLFVPLGRVATRAVQGQLARHGLRRENALILGADEVGQAIEAKLRRRRELGLHVVGYLDADPPPGIQTRVPIYRDLGLLRELVAQHQIKHIILSFTNHRSEELLWLLRTYDDLDVQFSVVPRLWEITWPSYEMSHIEDVTVLQLRKASLSLRDRIMKRCMDLLLAGIGVVLLAPVFIIIAILVKLDSPGPILFRSERPGRHGKHFKMLKFRTMVVGAAKDTLLKGEAGAQERGILKLKDDRRITRVGRWLRRLSLDELPQLFNVLKGEMSLVGPRPLLLQEAEQCIGWERKRMDVLPGITGYWQILGRSDLGFEERMRLDYLYIRNWSLMEDLRILVNTIGAVLAQKGAY